MDWTPTSPAAVRADYSVGTGVGHLDLSGLDLEKGQIVSTRVSVGVGQAKVTVPDGVAVILSIDVGFGDIRLPGEGDKDVDISPGQRERLTLEPVGGRDPRGTLSLELKTGLGQVEVTRAAS
jgi:hypothetical protein